MFCRNISERLRTITLLKILRNVIGDSTLMPQSTLKRSPVKYTFCQTPVLLNARSKHFTNQKITAVDFRKYKRDSDMEVFLKNLKFAEILLTAGSKITLI